MKLLDKTIVGFGDKAVTITKEGVSASLQNDGCSVLGFWDHSKAAEKYALLSISNNETSQEWPIPIYYYRQCIFCKTETEVVEYLRSLAHKLSSSTIDSFIKNEHKHYDEVFGAKSDVTGPIFLQLLNNCGSWVDNKTFKNQNSQRRILAIKEKGYTIATKTEKQSTYHMLLPLQHKASVQHETISNKTKRRIINLLKKQEEFYQNSRGLFSLSILPDHKFPEIRWNIDTPESNDDLTDEELIAKFQLVPEKVNQEKREVCRRCFLTGYRGTVGGLPLFTTGTSVWSDTIPINGKDAKGGCVGCYWYDIQAWRDHFMNILNSSEMSVTD